MVDATMLPGHRPGAVGPSARATLARLAVVVLAALVVSHAVVRETRAAFSGTTANGGNSFGSGTVSLSDDDSGSAMFSVSDMKPADTVYGCITVTYTGSLAASVKVYASATVTTLAPYLDLTVKEGSMSGGSDCQADFSAGDTIFSPGTVQSFLTAHTGWANGLAADNGGWTPAGGSNASKTFQFTVTLQDDDNAQAKAVTGLAFTWEAQST